MKTRSANKKKYVKSGCGGSSTASDLDENLWGDLQHHINLAENVYSKLPFEEFFHLRTVCKDWYNIARKRLGLKEPIHEPFFTLFTKCADGTLDGILVYNGLSRSWDWRTGYTHNTNCHFVSRKGVVFSPCVRYGTYELYSAAGAFHWQSQTFQVLPPVPAALNMDERVILGMSISEYQDPFCVFKVVCGSQDSDTQVYESGKWQTKPCRVPKKPEMGGNLHDTQVYEPGKWQTKPCRVPKKPEMGGNLQASTGCVDCNGRVYITTEHRREIFVYDFEKASWSSLSSPSNWVSKEPAHYNPDTLGAWNGRVFDVTNDFKPGRSEKNYCVELIVWELVDESLGKWEVYNRMPKGLYSWLRSNEGFLPLKPKLGDVSIQSSFCGDYMLVYAWDFGNGCAGRFCLFNMDTKNWQKLKIPAGTLAFHQVYSSDPYDPYDSDDSSDYDAYANASYLDEFRMDDYSSDDDSESDFGL